MAGQPTVVADPLGETTSDTYDGTGNLVSVVNAEPDAAWDPYFPRLDAMSDGSGETTYRYYAAGVVGGLRLKSETGPFAAIGYTYDALGRLASRTVGSAATETFAYDAIGRLASHGTPLGTFDYDYLGATGQLTSRAPAGGGGIATSWSYLGNLRDRRLASIANTPGRSFAYTTTPTDLITGIAETPSPPGQNWGFSYDPANRLTAGQSTSEGGYPYTLDPAGNITQFGTTAAAYNNVNELTSLGGLAYGWDAKPAPAKAGGNLLGYGADSFAWDAENRLAGIGYGAPPKGSAFAYDGLGHRVADTETDASGNTVLLDYVWCGNRLCQSQNANGAIFREYLPEGEYAPASGTAIYYGPDQLGSVRDAYVASPVVSMVQAFDYDPLGNALATPPSGPYPEFRYAGLYAHAGAGLELSRTRPYSPALGRWLGRDPLGEATDPSANLYRYADGNPISLTDPQRRFGLLGAVVGAAAGAGLDVAFQLATNGGQLQCLSAEQIAAAAGFGALVGSGAELVAAFGEATGLAAAEGVGEGTVSLFRAIGHDEAGSFLSEGGYAAGPSSGGKYFAFNLDGPESAMDFATHPFNANLGTMTMTQVEVPESFLLNGTRFFGPGGAGASIHFGDESLPQLNQLGPRIIGQ